eukprot:6261662-Prymnesium_polylepis.1
MRRLERRLEVVRFGRVEPRGAQQPEAGGERAQQLLRPLERHHEQVRAAVVEVRARDERAAQPAARLAAALRVRVVAAHELQHERKVVAEVIPPEHALARKPR